MKSSFAIITKIIFVFIVYVKAVPMNAQQPQILATIPGSAGSVSVPLNSGDTVLLDPNDYTARITIDATSLPACQSVWYYLNISYNDPATGHATSFNSQYSLVNGGYSADIVIPQEGGTAILTYGLPQVGYQTLAFSVHGTNISNARLQQTLSLYNAPGYFGSLLNQESTFRQFANSGLPLVVGNPDGIGIGQWDGVANNYVPSDATYWSTYGNIQDNINLFATKKVYATAFWNQKISAWQNDVNASQIYPPSTSFSYCTFSYPANPYGYEDGTAIQYYHTARVKFISFIPSTPGQVGTFNVNQSAYTSLVCSRPGP